ncbi:MAG: hypothetical protein R3C56_16340 [Pirellulaceae bacterium]
MRQTATDRRSDQRPYWSPSKAGIKTLDMNDSLNAAILPPGTKIGVYHIQRAIASGGMAEVYYAIHQELRRPSAIKILRPSLAADEVHLQRFMQEARAAFVDPPQYRSSL